MNSPVIICKFEADATIALSTSVVLHVFYPFDLANLSTGGANNLPLLFLEISATRVNLPLAGKCWNIFSRDDLYALWFLDVLGQLVKFWEVCVAGMLSLGWLFSTEENEPDGEGENKQLLALSRAVDESIMSLCCSPLTDNKLSDRAAENELFKFSPVVVNEAMVRLCCFLLTVSNSSVWESEFE